MLSRPVVPCLVPPTLSHPLLVSPPISPLRISFTVGQGTIRGDFALVTGRNICHGSDSVENAEKEIALYVLVIVLCCRFIN